MLSRCNNRLTGLKQNIISFAKQSRERQQSNAVRIAKASKALEVDSCRVRAVVRVAAIFGLPIVYNAALASKTKPPPPLIHEMEESTTLESVLQHADQLYDENHFQEVIDLLDKHKEQNLPEIQWRKARAIYSHAKSIKDKSEKEKQVQKSFELIKTALETDPTNYAIHKWMAIILDAASEQRGIKARILELDNIKFHMNEAMRLNPEDPTVWHMMGAYEYGLAELSWIQRKLVSTIFASPPTGSFEKALEHFEKAESLKEGFYTMNWLMLGKCNMALNHNEKARGYLEKAANCSVLNEDDKKCKEEAVALLRKL